MPFELRRQPNGSFGLFHTGLKETMHPTLGPWEEATGLYVGGTHLEQALAAAGGRSAAVNSRASKGTPPPARGAGGEVVVFDVGLGGAANALAAIACREGLVRAGRQARPLALVSFEQDLEALAFVIEHADQLGYPRGYLDALGAILRQGAWDAPGVTWELRKGDFAERIQAEPRRADIVFYDPFSRRNNPGMWSVPVLESVYRCRRPGAGQRLVTYSSAYSVRAAFLLAGYYVGEGMRQEGRNTTIAVTSFSDLEEPLDLAWLGRWRKDREPWPPGTAEDQHRAVREALVAHSQWSQFEGQEEPAPKPFPRHRAHPGSRAKPWEQRKPRPR